ncbi:MAG TPA: glycoside hydrolase family 140 protein [Acidobacteriaceae bacterium]|nr:glycoside hydrolase family 140 protein [Acidobacteriaceae bacterium]
MNYQTGIACLFFASALLSTAAAAENVPAADGAWSVSSNHRYLLDSAGKPFFVQGEAAWSLIANVSDADVELYLRNRRAKGFNTLLVNLLEHKFSKNPPCNLNGDAPFEDMNDWSKPNEKYFAHADWVIRKAGEYGMTVLLAPVYLGYIGTDEGFIDEVLKTGASRSLKYGQFLGKRYAGYNNIIWVMGGDRNPGAALEELDMIAFGIKQFDHRHLFTAHCHPDAIPAEQYPNGWLDFGNTYDYQIVHQRLIDDYNRKPTRPNFLIETTYEGEHNASQVQIRRQAYWAILCGGFGHVFGNLPIWAFKEGWQNAMDLPGSIDMMYWGKLFRSRAWFDLIPDQDHTIVTSGLGEFNGLDYLAAARTSDRNTVIAYIPDSRKMTVDLTKLNGDRMQGWWFNPRNGKAVSIGSFPTSASKQFTPPSEGDWVLVLDNVSKHLAAPGQ